MQGNKKNLQAVKQLIEQVPQEFPMLPPQVLEQLKSLQGSPEEIVTGAFSQLCSWANRLELKEYEENNVYHRITKLFLPLKSLLLQPNGLTYW